MLFYQSYPVLNLENAFHLHISATSRCTFENGNGAGVGQTLISRTITGTACVEACVARQKWDNLVNGVTILRSGAGGCYCERGMKYLIKSEMFVAEFKSCFLKDISAHNTSQVETTGELNS